MAVGWSRIQRCEKPWRRLPGEPQALEPEPFRWESGFKSVSLIATVLWARRFVEHLPLGLVAHFVFACICFVPGGTVKFGGGVETTSTLRKRRRKSLGKLVSSKNGLVLYLPKAVWLKLNKKD